MLKTIEIVLIFQKNTSIFEEITNINEEISKKKIFRNQAMVIFHNGAIQGSRGSFNVSALVIPSSPGSKEMIIIFTAKRKSGLLLLAIKVCSV